MYRLIADYYSADDFVVKRRSTSWSELRILRHPQYHFIFGKLAFGNWFQMISELIISNFFFQWSIWFQSCSLKFEQNFLMCTGILFKPFVSVGYLLVISHPKKKKTQFSGLGYHKQVSRGFTSGKPVAVRELFCVWTWRAMKKHQVII